MRMKRLRHLTFLTAFLLICSIPAAPQQGNPPPDPTTKRLLNGLQVTVAETPALGSDLAIGLVVRHGAYFDPANKSGVANILSRMFLKAAVDRTEKDIREELEYLGAEVDIACDWDGFRIVLRGQSSAYERSLLLLYQAIGEAQFNEADFAAVKRAVLEELQKPPDPRQRILRQFQEVLFDGTSHARPLAGTPQSVASITVGDVRHFYRRFITPNQASLVVVGDVRARQVMQRAARIWGVWVRNDDVPFTFVQPREPVSRQIFVEDDPASPAAQFVMGNLFPPRDDASYASALLAAHIFQERLTKALPTSLLTVGTEGRRMPGPFYVQGQSAAEQAVQEILRIESVAEEMKLSPVSAEEVESVRARLLDEFRGGLNTPAGLCGIMLEAELYRLGSSHASAFPEQLRRSTPDTILQAAKKFIFPDGEVLLIRGPAAVLRPVLGPLGTLRPMQSGQ